MQETVPLTIASDKRPFESEQLKKGRLGWPSDLFFNDGLVSHHRIFFIQIFEISLKGCGETFYSYY